MRIEDLDKNFKQKTKVTETDVFYRDAKCGEFEIFGLANCEEYTRIKECYTKNFSEGVKNLAKCTAGGRIRFKTNSPYIVLKGVVSPYDAPQHMTRITRCGFSVYDRNVFKRSLAPEISGNCEFENIYYFRDNNEHDVTIYLPLYGGVEKIYIGLKNDAYIKKSNPYGKKIMYYGSSITQGGCASRPGNSYPSIISRKLNTDYVNLGFSGNAKGEKEVAEYIATLDFDIFVYDYDHNAPDVKDLEKTHKPFFDIIRKSHKDVPVVFVTRPDVKSNSEASKNNRDVIYKTYKTALCGGDKNVYFIDGKTLWGEEGYSECTVDGCHPADLGMYRMANVIGGVIEEIINGKNK